MYLKIEHNTIYTYNQQVFLKPHLVQLRPRSDGWQKLHDFSLIANPQPTGVAEIIDLDGNSIIQLWFTQPTEELHLQIKSEIETFQTNPFNYLLAPWALKLPFDYPSSLLSQIAPYLKSYSFTPDPVAIQLAQEIAQETQGDTLAFLMALNLRIYNSCEYINRYTGEPWEAGVTWNSKRGCCRDYAVLFMECCRAVGLAARFVSGYNEGDRSQKKLDLHAWAEVYLPGGGWRGYDPTLGLAVSDRHVALAASAIPSYAAPIVGEVTALSGSKPPESKMEAYIIKS